MPKPFDATLKDLIAAFPADWLRLLGVPAGGPVEVLSPDLSTVTAAADTLLKVGGEVVHIDVESGPDDRLAGRLLLYNVLAHRHTGLPVHSVAVLLRANAKAANLTGELAYAPRPGGEVRFRFEVVRVWERTAEELLAAGVGLMPLAVLGRPPAGQSRQQAIPGLIARVSDEARRVAPDRAAQVVAAALILAGMHADKAALSTLLRRLEMEEKNVTIEILKEWGAIEALKRSILGMGRARFGNPTTEQERAINGIEDLDRLDRLTIRILKAKGWADLLRGR